MKNKTCRKLLEKKYGKGCFMERAGIREITPEQEEKMKRTIKGYKKISRKITYHHIKQKAHGGEVSMENGANLAEYNHVWLHQQTEEKRKEINQKLQEFKHSIDIANLQITQNGLEVKEFKKIDLDMSETIEIPVYDNIKDTIKQKEKFNRAKEKRSIKKEIEDELDR